MWLTLRKGPGKSVVQHSANGTALSPLKGSTQVSSALAWKYYFRVEVMDIGKHSSLLQYIKKYCCKKFYSTGPQAGSN